MLPFTPEDFGTVFGAYNRAIWPIQMLAYPFAAAGLGAVLLRLRRGWSVLAFCLSAMWVAGAGYHLVFFATINPMAQSFGVLFLVQAVLLAWSAGTAAPVSLAKSVSRRVTGWTMVGYACAIYPAIGVWLHGYPNVPLFGVTPCPVTIFTFGALLLVDGPARRLLAIPVLWSLVGGSAAFLLGIVQDWVLLASGPMALALILMRRGGRGAAA